MRKVINQICTFRASNNQIITLDKIGRLICSAAFKDILMKQRVVGASCQQQYIVIWSCQVKQN